MAHQLPIDDISKTGSMPLSELLDQLHTSTSGLTKDRVAANTSQYGKNVLSKNKRRSKFIEFIKNFTNPLVFILLVIAVVSFALNEVLDGSIIFGMVILSVTLNFFQEHKASMAAAKLLEHVALLSTTLRDGKEHDVLSEDLVPGDILVLNAGDLIPADARILEAKDFFVNQSALTGESYPVEKLSTPPTTPDTDLIELHNLLFAGSNVITGNAKAIIVRTGSKTQFGSIVKDVSGSEQDNNFTLGIKNFSYFILRIVVIFVLFIFAINALIKHDLVESITFAIAVAVGLTPEFLPMIMSVTMAKGAVVMSKKGVIVKKLTAIPTFGSMDILCTDKTGTITEDKITLVKYLNFCGETDNSVLELAYVNSCLQTGITNPLDEAIKQFTHIPIESYKKVDEIPFDFERKRMSVITHTKNEQLMICKGAPEAIFEVSTKYFSEQSTHTLDQPAKKKLVQIYQDLSKGGYRVLAIATKVSSASKQKYSKVDENDMTFIGFTAFLDPVKKNAKEAIDKLEAIGIEIKVITGDNELVTQKACEEAGIEIKSVILGHQIHALTDEELGLLAVKTTIFARFSPAEKNRIISSLRSQNHVVGYMGDGINDAPSLQSADVGISVSNAVDVAKETADFILTHKSLVELADGVIEGRKIFGNTMKYIMMGLSSNFGNMFSVLGAVLFLPFLPMLPIQILLNNFLYDLSQLTIPSDNVDQEYLQQPKRWDVTFIRKFMLGFGPISSLFDLLTFAVLYMTVGHNPSAFRTGWFIESLATQTLVIHIIRTRKLPFVQSRPSAALLISTIVIVALGWLVPFTHVGTLFGFTALPANVLILLSALVIGYLCMVEVSKQWFYRTNTAQ